MLPQPGCVPPHGITVEDVIAGCTRGTGTNQGGGALPTLDNAWAQAATASVEVCAGRD